MQSRVRVEGSARPPLPSSSLLRRRNSVSSPAASAPRLPAAAAWSVPAAAGAASSSSWLGLGLGLGLGERLGLGLGLGLGLRLGLGLALGSGLGSGPRLLCAVDGRPRLGRVQQCALIGV